MTQNNTTRTGGQEVSEEIRELRDGRTVIIDAHKLVNGEDTYHCREYGRVRMDYFWVTRSELKPQRLPRRVR